MSLGSIAQSTFRDLNQAFRVILKTPLLSAIAVVSLALGIAANVTVFSVVHSFLLRPLPYENADDLVMLWENPVARAGNQWPASPATFLDWQRSTQSFESMTALELTSANLTGRDQPLRIDAAFTQDNFFETIRGLGPIRGRTFTTGDASADNGPVAVIKEDLWRNHYGAAEDLVGSQLSIDGESHTVIGIMPQAFDFLVGNVDLWAARDFRAEDSPRDDRRLSVAARLKPGLSLDQGRQEMSAVAERLSAAFPESHEGWGVYIQTLDELFPGPTDSQLIKVLQGVALLVLLIACVNVASLLLAQADSRQKEMALRTALGAGKGRLLRLLMTESLVLAGFAGLLGLGFGYFGVRLGAQGMPELLPAVYWPRFEGPVIAFGLLVSLIAGLAFGLGPAMQAVRHPNLRQTLSDGTRGGSTGKDRKRALGFFVMAELAMALAILIGAAVLTDLFHDRLSGDPGFDSTGVLTAHLTLPEYRYPDDAAVARLAEALERQLKELGGVESVAMTSALPRSRFVPRREMEVAGRPAQANEAPRIVVTSVTPSFFKTLGIGQSGRIEGRLLTLADGADGAPVAVVNQQLVDQHFSESEGISEGDGSPLGHQLKIEGRSWTIVGVVPNFAQERLDGLTPHAPLAILPFAQRPVRDVYPLLKAHGDPYSLASGLQATVSAVAPDQPVGEIVTLEKFVKTELAGPTVISQILYGIGLLALILAAFGIYGVMAFRVSRQTNEIGIRLALGARPAQILSRIGGQGLRLASAGLVLGIPVAGAVVILIGKVFEAGQSQGMDLAQSIGLVPMLKVLLLLVAVSMLACFLPSVKATRVDPQKALQAE